MLGQLRGAFGPGRSPLPREVTRLRELARAHVLLGRVDSERLLAENNLVPRLVTRADIHQLGFSALPGSTPYLVLFEREPFGYPWPGRTASFTALVRQAVAEGRADPLLDGAQVQLWRIRPPR